VYTPIISDPQSLQDLNLNLTIDSYYHYEDKKLLTLTGFFHIQLHTMSLNGLYNVGCHYLNDIKDKKSRK